VADLAVTGPSLRVRIPRADDAAALYLHASDPEVTRWFSWGPYTSEDQAVAYLARLPGQRERGEQLDLVVEHLRDGPIGIVGLSELSPRDRRASIGTWLGRDWWGTGANRECKALMCHVAFALLGFEREGVLRRFHRHHGRSLDVAVFSLLREDWLTGPLHEVPVTVQGSAPQAFVVKF
jgi:ribosomal-protein-alanine N-acetyltransferase